MLHFCRSLVAVSTFALLTVANGYSIDKSIDVNNGLQPRVLKAAAREVDIAKRESTIELKHDVLLHYFDDASNQHKDPFAAHVLFSASKPTLVLEDIDHSINEVHCEEGTISLETHPVIFSDALNALTSHPEILLVTSHATCNERGERVPYLTSFSRAKESSSSIELLARPVRWTDAYNMQVEYGVDYDRYKINSHDHLRRRSVYERQPSPTAAATVASTGGAVFPTPAASSLPNATSVSQDITSQFINAQILPSASNNFTVNSQGLPSDLTLECQNCTFTGTVSLSTGSFNISNGTISSGRVEVTADNLFAHVNLNAAFPVDFTKAANFTLLDRFLSPFQIPEIAKIGPELVIDLLLAASVNANVNTTFGFEVAVPNNSTATADIADPLDSGLTGFQDTQFTSLPFDANVQNLAANISATLQPQLLIGISLLNSTALKAGAGIFFDLPTLILSINEVNNTDTNCNPTTNQSIINNLSYEYDALLNIVPTVELAAGFLAQATASLASVTDQTTYTAFATTLLPSTACLAFQKGSAGGLVSPTLLPANQTATTLGVGPIATVTATGPPGGTATGVVPSVTGTAAGGGNGTVPTASSTFAIGAAAGVGSSKTVLDAAVVQALVVGGLMLLGPVLVL